MTDEKTARIRELNDQLRASGQGGLILVTRGLLNSVFPSPLRFALRSREKPTFPLVTTLITSTISARSISRATVSSGKSIITIWIVDIPLTIRQIQTSPSVS